jgi:hypothetical protein
MSKQPKKKPTETHPIEVRGTGGLRGIIRAPKDVKAVPEKPESRKDERE